MSDVVRNKRDAILKVIDGTPTTPVETTIVLMEPDFTFKEPPAKKPIYVKNRKGNLDHIKKNDPFNEETGSVDFTVKFKDKTFFEKLTAPANTTAVEADKVPSGYLCVKMYYIIYDENGTDVIECDVLYNVWFDPGAQQFNEGDEYSTMKFHGEILGKYDAAADSERTYVDRLAAIPT